MASVTNLVVAVRTTGANQIRGISDGLRSAGTAGRQAADTIRRDFDRATAALDRANDATGRAERNQRDLAAASNNAALEVRRLGRLLDDLRASGAPADQIRDMERALHAAERGAQRARDAYARGTHELHQMRFAAQGAAHAVDNLADQWRQVQRAQNSFAGRFGAIFADGIREAVSNAWQALPQEVRAGIAIAGIAMAAMLATAIGAAIGGLLTAALGGAFLAAGVAIVAKTSNHVRQAFGTLFADIGVQAKDMATNAFEMPLIRSARSIRDAWQDIRGEVSSVFLDLSHAVEPLVEGIAGMARSAMPGFQRAIAAATPLLRDLGRMLPHIGQVVGDFFATVASGEGNMEGLRFIVKLVCGTLTLLGNTIRWLSDRFHEWVALADMVFGALAKIPGLGAVFEPFARAFGDLTNQTTGSARALEAVPGAAGAAADGLGETRTAAQQAADALKDLSEKMFDVMKSQLSADEARLAWNKGMIELRKELGHGSRSLDENTAAGIENLEVIHKQIGAAIAARDAAVRLAEANGDTAGVERANRAYAAQIEQLRGVLLKLGFSKTAVDQLIASYNKVPSGPFITTFRANFEVSGRASTYASAMAALGKGNVIRTSGGRIGYAAGTPAAPPGWAWVGEEGPELLKFAGGEEVLNTRESARRAAASSGAAGGAGAGRGGGMTLTLSGGGTQDAVVSMFAHLLRTGAMRLAAGGVPVRVA